MKIAHFGDSHLTYRQYNLACREQDFRDAFLATCKYIQQGQVDLVLFVGDLFHARDIKRSEYSVAREGLALLDNVVVIPGNHDKALFSKEGLWLHQLADEGLLTLLGANGEKAQYFELDEVRIIGVPYLGWQIRDELIDLANTMPKVSKPTVLMLHVGITDIMPGFPGVMGAAELRALFQGKVDYIAVGHYHVPWNDGLIYSSGSLERTMIDQFAGGVWFFDTTSPETREFVPITEYYDPRPFHDIIVKDIGGVKASRLDLRASITRFNFSERVPSLFAIQEALGDNQPRKILVASRVGMSDVTVDLSDVADVERHIFEELMPGYAEQVQEVLALVMTEPLAVVDLISTFLDDREGMTL